ncbi:MAG: sensor histidine kinase [Acidobacteriaceae bacterium]
MSDPRRILPRVAIGLSLLNILAGSLIIAGWQFRIPLLKGAMLGTFVAPNTALSFLLCGVAILLQLSGSRWRPYLGVIVAIFVTLFAAATLSEYIFRLDLGIDRLFMPHRLADWTLPNPGRYVLNTGIGFLLAGLSLITLRRESRRFVTELFALVVLLISYLSLIAYLYGAPSLYNHVMAVHTAALFAVLSVALLCAPPQPLVADILFSPFTGAVASRKMIIAIVFLLPAFGAIQLWAEEGGLVTFRFGVTISVIATVTVFTVFALWTAASLNEADRRKAEIERALLRSGQIAAAGRMAASIAHEINNPLESITNIIYLLKIDGIPEELRRNYLDAAESELIRVAAIARRTLGFYREEVKPTEFEVSALLDSVLDVYRNKLEGKVTVHRFYAGSGRVIGKPGEVRQVFANLIANAIDAMRNDPRQLDITISGDAQRITVEIADNGCGIEGTNLDRIFDPFFTTKKDTGTGLGLWVSRELVARNNGVISVASSADAASHGTIFRLTFPAASATGAGPEKKGEPLRAESTSRS